ncbi:MAG: type II secretion system F family protein [Verrucomicrobiota bacterium JB023]|nr:type II secretion system F family protein [Verrucomicrobiota bacterium JB023]
MSEAVAKNAGGVQAKEKAPPKSIELFGITIGGEPAVKPLKKKEQLHMFRGLASMLKAQINTADAVKYYAQGLPNKGLSKSLMQIHSDINAGVSVHEAFRKSKRFDDMAIGLIQAGSDSGQLFKAFGSLASRLKTDLAFEKAIRKATVMPSIVISVLIGAFIMAQVKIVPQVEAMLSDVGQEPDGMTAIAFKVSHFTQNVWMFAIPALIAVILVIAFVDKVRNLVLLLAMSRLRTLKLLIMGLRQSTFLGTMELLYSNGINLAKAIRVSANSVKRTPFYDELKTAADKYEHTGVPISTAFGKYTSADDQVVHMLAIGERSASLDVQLKMLAEMLEEDAENHMSDFTNLLNFVVLLIAVGLIAAVFIGTFLPIFLMGPKMMQAGM